ncbi:MULTISPECIES: hypothetical protein [unclassified Thioalkalivibrio]|uniref:hypothetical protein n=1 Tax=unclassified Thioalkalivibrio TaxID=2621013 RepID=UPI0003788567|nr:MULTISPECIES: hypothetical protein [unclassified Thioalkalivibrio]
MAGFVILAIVGLVSLTLAVIRMYSHLAVQERRVVGAWDQLERLLVQRNGHLQRLCSEAGSRVCALQNLHRLLERQEMARRQGDLSTVADTEREIRATWDLILEQPVDIKEEIMDEAERRVGALDQAIGDNLVRYNAALETYQHTRRSPFYGPLAWAVGMGPYAPLNPPSSDNPSR